MEKKCDRVLSSGAFPSQILSHSQDTLNTHTQTARKVRFRLAAPCLAQAIALETLGARVSQSTIFAWDLDQGGQAGACVTNSTLQGVCRQTRKDKGFRLDAQALPHPDCLPPYMKLVNSMEASLEPSAISPGGGKWRDVDIGIYKPWCGVTPTV